MQPEPAVRRQRTAREFPAVIHRVVRQYDSGKCRRLDSDIPECHIEHVQCMFSVHQCMSDPFSALTLLVGWQEVYPACKSLTPAIHEGPLWRPSRDPASSGVSWNKISWLNIKNESSSSSISGSGNGSGSGSGTGRGRGRGTTTQVCPH